MAHFGDKRSMKYFEIAGDRSRADIAELSKLYKWLVQISNVKYEHLWDGEENDMFLQMNVGYDFQLRRIRRKLKEKIQRLGSAKS